MIRSAMIAVGIVCAGAACVASGASRPELQGWSSHTFGLDMVRSEIGGDSIWIGTRGGVLRFRADAEQFSKFTRLDGCLPSNVVTGLAIDETRGDVWVATQRGIARTPIDTPEGEAWEVFDGSNSPFERDVTDIAVGHDGTVYIGTFEDSVWTYDGAVFTQLPVIEGPGDNALASRSIISVFVDSDGLLWVGMDGGVIDMYDGETFTHVTEAETFPGGVVPNIPCEQVPLLPPDDLGLLGPVIRVLGENPAEGTIWFQNLAESPQCGTFGGITSFDGANWTTYTTANSAVPNDLADGIGVGPAGETILLTPAGNAALIGGEWVPIGTPPARDSVSGFGAIWFATPADGLVRVADTPTPDEGIDVTAFKPDGILGLNVNAVATEPGGGLLVASSDGLQRIGPDGRFETIVSGFNVRSVFRTSDGEIWAGTQGREVFRVRADGTVNTIQFNVTNNAAIHEDASGEIWIGSVNSGGLTVFDGSAFRVIGTHNSALPSNTIRDIELDNAGTLWFATPAGVARYDGEDFTTLTFADGLASTTTNTVFARGNGEIWVGHPSGSRGISVIDGGSITTMSVNGNRVTAITEDADGAIWIGHQFSGVSVQRADGSFERFDMNSSGLLNDVINRAVSDPSGRRVLFATDQGIAVRELAGAPCPGDCDGSGVVDFNDLVAMLFEFDAPSAPASCDTDGDALVTFNDLVAALFLFGPCDGDGLPE